MIFVAEIVKFEVVTGLRHQLIQYQYDVPQEAQRAIEGLLFNFMKFRIWQNNGGQNDEE